MKNITISIIKVICRVLFAYLVVLLFTTNFNILEWNTSPKVWFLIISIILLSND